MAENIYSAFDDQDRPSEDLIKDCVHCGFCLSACPTYLETGNELDSPRGRIYLMKSALDGEIPIEGSLVTHLDRCLGCLACEPACPSGVQYGSLIETSRSQIERRYKRGEGEKIHRRAIFSLFLYPERLKLMMPFLYLYQKLGLSSLIRSTGVLGKISPKLEQMEAMMPPVNSFSAPPPLDKIIAAKGEKRFRVAMLTGCVQSVFFSNTNGATARVLSENGCEVIVPRDQGCCGALSVHSGRLEEGREFARNTIKTFEDLELDALIINSAGCGSTIKEYFEILKDDPVYSERAKALSMVTKDVMEFLDEIGLRTENLSPLNISVTYQDACHLGNAQRIKSQPRNIISSIPGVELQEMHEAELCCGSAGIYNLVQPEMSQQLLERKMQNLTSHKVDYLTAGNPGCLLQIKQGIDKHGLGIKIAHPIELLDMSYQAGDK